MTEPTRAEICAGIRELADWLEAHPEVPTPYSFTWGAVDIYPEGVEGMAVVAQAMGNCKKEVNDTFLRISRQFGPVTVRANEHREKCCERRVIGTEEVEEKIATAFETRTVQREIVEWDCGSILKEAGVA